MILARTAASERPLQDRDQHVVRVFYTVVPPAAERLCAALDAELVARYPRSLRVQDLPSRVFCRFLRLFASSSPRRQRAVLLAEIDGEPVGCLTLFHDGADSLELGRMYVVPEQRGTGAADVLLTRAEETALALGCRRIRLETGKAQPEAVAVYLRHGYERTSRWGRYRGNAASLCYAKPVRPFVLVDTAA